MSCDSYWTGLTVPPCHPTVTIPRSPLAPSISMCHRCRMVVWPGWHPSPAPSPVRGWGPPGIFICGPLSHLLPDSSHISKGNKGIGCHRMSRLPIALQHSLGPWGDHRGDQGEGQREAARLGLKHTQLSPLPTVSDLQQPGTVLAPGPVVSEVPGYLLPQGLCLRYASPDCSV